MSHATDQLTATERDIYDRLEAVRATWDGLNSTCKSDNDTVHKALSDLKRALLHRATARLHPELSTLLR